MESVIVWMLLVATLGLAVGFSFVRFLTVHPHWVGFCAFLVCFCGFGLILIVNFMLSGWERPGAIALCIVSICLGYAWATNRLLSRQDNREIPPLIRQKGDPGSGWTAVVYMTHGEPPTYNPIGWINQFRELDERKTPFIPKLIRPYFIFLLRKAYIKVGTSHHRSIHQLMLHRLEELYRSNGDPNTRFYLSFLDDDPRPDAATITALNDGTSRIVVAEVFVSISNHTVEGEHFVKSVKADEFVPVRFTDPLWDSFTLQRMFVEKANAVRGDTEKANIGIILVGHGQPDEWDREFASETAHEIEFRERILELFVEEGYQRENLGLAWMEFKQPKPAVKVEELVRNGVSKILYFSAAISADSIHSQYDIPALIAKAKIPVGVELVNMGAWNDHPLAIEAIREKIVLEINQFPRQ